MLNGHDEHSNAPLTVETSPAVRNVFTAIQDEHSNAPVRNVFTAIQGHWLSACLRVLLELKVPEALDAAAAPLAVEQVASAVGVNPKGVSHLYKVMRTAAQYQLLEELPGQRFVANDSTLQLVRKPGKPSLGHLAAHLVNGPKWEAWEKLPEAVKSGKVAFAMAHEGLDVYQYGEAPGQEEFADEFMNAMSYFTQHSLEGGPTLGEMYDWKNCRSVMDVGGGRGELLSRTLAAAGKGCKGILFDRPFVLDSIDIEGTFKAKGVAEEQLQRVSGDVREPFPEVVAKADLDTIVMKHFLSAFSDEDCAIIVRNCAAVLREGGRLLLLQTLVPEAGDTENNTCADGVAPGLFALEILTQCPGGAWRTLTEWKAIFKGQGMDLTECKALGCNMHCMIFAKDVST